MKNPLLTRYWILFNPSKYIGNPPMYTRDSYGVTAYSEADAFALLSKHLFRGGLPSTEFDIIADIDVSTLDANHVRKNMGDPTIRGIWWPRLDLNL